MTRDVIRALGRRWYVIVVGLLVTVGLAWGAYRITPPTYTSSALILLLPSETTVGPGGNPFLALSNLDQPAGILVAYFSGTTAQAQVKEHSPTAQYTVAINSSTRGPIIEVDVTDKTSEGALSALDYITGQIPAELSSLQKQVDAPANAVITSMPLTVDQKAKADYSGTIRMVITAVVVGLLATGLIAFALDGLLLSRRARRQARAAREAPGTGTPGPAEPRGRRQPRSARRRAEKPVPAPEAAVETVPPPEGSADEASANESRADEASADESSADESSADEPSTDESAAGEVAVVAADAGRET
ncbi:hypothetical protein [Leifsonia sp. AG29]|uniref:hypothetical protein n=1 Tax=Leifsonia sp. AG29 TaxID=2598860 RepID=UPI00131BA4ED|nr:hypothetical protein [Leifsonia sp. AG29]